MKNSRNKINDIITFISIFIVTLAVIATTIGLLLGLGLMGIGAGSFGDVVFNFALIIGSPTISFIVTKKIIKKINERDALGLRGGKTFKIIIYIIAAFTMINIVSFGILQLVDYKISAKEKKFESTLKQNVTEIDFSKVDLYFSYRSAGNKLKLDYGYIFVCEGYSPDISKIYNYLGKNIELEKEPRISVVKVSKDLFYKIKNEFTDYQKISIASPKYKYDGLIEYYRYVPNTVGGDHY